MFVFVIVKEDSNGCFGSAGSVGVTDTRGKKKTAPAIPPTMVQIANTSLPTGHTCLGLFTAFCCVLGDCVRGRLLRLRLLFFRVDIRYEVSVIHAVPNN